MDAVCLKTGIPGISSKIPVAPSQVRAIGRSAAEKSTAVPPPEKKTASPGLSLKARPLEFLWPGGGGGGGVKGKRDSAMGLDDAVLVENGDGRRVVVEKGKIGETGETEGQKGNWVLKILQVGSMRREKERRKEGSGGEEETVRDAPVENDVVSRMVDDHHDECFFCRAGDGEEELEFDRESFSRMLTKVRLDEAKLYARMSYLGNMAYSIPKIKPENLLKYHGLRFVSSSIEKRESATRSENFQASSEDQTTTQEEEEEKGEENKDGYRTISPSVAYRIAASAASHLYSRSKIMLPFRSSRSQEDDNVVETLESEVASLMVTTDSVTAVVAAKEEVKQAVADNLKSTRSSPCEWFVCDDDKHSMRLFVIQGSESLASWQANLLFEPVPFEELDVLVHRGIYEAAKGIYEQMLPEVHAHLKSRGKSRAFLRFTGHSLGGSLSLLVNLMLLIRGQVPASSLLPVITFGSPCIMCGGDRLLQKLGLPKTHLLAITMHRDIVPRAFSCSYPNRVAELLKAVNGNLRTHPCLNKQKLLYSPMGELLILQPDEKFASQHPLLPRGSGLYILTSTSTDIDEAERQLRAAKTAFLNSPHPLEILSDRSAYGSEGIIKRDHDVNSYLKSLKHVIRQELKRTKAKQDRPQVEFSVPCILRTGRESLKRIGGFVASQCLHLAVVFFFPVRLLLNGVYGVICHR